MASIIRVPNKLLIFVSCQTTLCHEISPSDNWTQHQGGLRGYLGWEQINMNKLLQPKYKAGSNQQNQTFGRGLIQWSPRMVTCLGRSLACCLQDKTPWGRTLEPTKKKPVTDQLTLHDCEQVCSISRALFNFMRPWEKNSAPQSHNYLLDSRRPQDNFRITLPTF